MNETQNTGCTRECARCTSAQHSYCAVVMAQKNQELLLSILGAMAQPQDLITPMQGGEEDPADIKHKTKSK